MTDLGDVESDEVESEKDAAERLAADTALLEDLAAASFTGPLRQVFRDRLWTEGMPILLSFLRTGRIMELCHSRGVQVKLNQHIRLALHTSPETRDEFAVDILAQSVERFIDTVLKPGKWQPGPGRASLTTFFIGHCSFSFAQVLREYQNTHRLLMSDEALLDQLHVIEQALAPDDRAVVMDTLRKILAEATPNDRHICALILQDYSQVEIAEQMDISAKAVESQMRRLRAKVRRMVRRRQIENPFSRPVNTTMRRHNRARIAAPDSDAACSGGPR